MNPIECIPCRNRQLMIMQKLSWLQVETKVKAVNENRSYAIWFDEEDTKYRALPLDQAEDYAGCYDFQIISQYP